MHDKEDRSRTLDRTIGIPAAVVTPLNIRPGSGLAVPIGRPATGPAIKEQKDKARGLGLSRFTSGRKTKK